MKIPMKDRARMRLFATTILFCAIASAAMAQDVVTVGSATATGSTVDIPVSIRDVAGTPLGIDRPAGSKIQSFSIKVTYSPASSVSAITFSRSGITANLTPTSEFAPAAPPSISLLDTFQESTNPIPFTLNAPAPGNVVAHLVVTLSPSAPAGSSISLTLDPTLTQLTDEGGTAATKETVANGQLALVNGTITVPQLSLQLAPPTQNATPGTTAFITATTSSNVTSDTTISLSSSNPSVATVPPSIVITAGTKFVTINVNAVALGSATITATLPQSAGGASATARVNVVTSTTPCAQPSPPQISGPPTADSGSTYTITWPAVIGATEYAIDESTDANFTAPTTRAVTTTSASYTHANAGTRYYYRVRSHNGSAGCDFTSTSSDSISVLINAAPVPPTRILAVVGSLTGSANSFFRTSVQLYNPKNAAISGKIIFHTQNVSGSANDPSLAYSLAAHKTLSYADLLPAMGITSGIGSADLVADSGSSLPLTLVRVFNDGGAQGTSGLAEEALSTDDALQQGDSASLIAPDDVARFRLNIGVRTLTNGAAFSITVRDKNGNVVKSTTKSFTPTFFRQFSSSEILDGYALTGGETISFDVTSGNAFIYGATTDNTTNDPSVQFARPVE